MAFHDDDYVEFAKLTQDKVIGTRNDKATIYDLNEMRKVRELKSSGSNMYSLNKATFNPTDDLVLNDGVLYDMRVAKEIHKFDKLNQGGNSIAITSLWAIFWRDYLGDFLSGAI